jgi:hypothetical protein
MNFPSPLHCILHTVINISLEQKEVEQNLTGKRKFKFRTTHNGPFKLNVLLEYLADCTMIVINMFLYNLLHTNECTAIL